MSKVIKAGIAVAVVLSTTAIVMNVRETKHRKAGEKALQDKLNQLPQDILDSVGLGSKSSKPKKEEVKETANKPKTETKTEEAEKA